MTIQQPPFPYDEYQMLLRQAFPCGHVTRTLCASRDTRQRWLVREQCANCGKLFRRQLRYRVLGGSSPELLPNCDLVAAQNYDSAYYSAAFALRDQFADARIEVWWAQYSAYLNSDAWRERSRATITAAGGICVYCHLRPAVQAHHICYARVGYEHPDDLRAVCLTCHRQEHPDTYPEP